jgi:lantibiotic biosynthesis protein
VSNHSSYLMKECSSAIWAPILLPESPTAARAWDSIDAIAQAVVSRDYKPTTQDKLRGHNYYEEALLYGYLAVARNDLEWANRATESLNLAIERAAENGGYLGLYGGITGLGWTVEHVSRLFEQIAAGDSSDEDENQAAESVPDELPEEDLNADVDAIVIRNLPHVTASSPYDLISGLVGFGIYFLERLPRQSAMEGITAILDQLERLSQQTNDGITWHSGPELLPDWQRQQCPGGYYNLGVAHGIPGIIHFLSEVSASQVDCSNRSYQLLDDAVRWFIAQARPSGSASRFSSWVVPGEEPTDSRMAWCYGDLGILAVLLQAARRADRPDWRQFADELLDHCLAWPMEKAGIGDAPLCHGAVGVAHIFNRIYQAEGDRRCLAAAVQWYEQTLAMRQLGSGVGGYSSLTRPDPDKPIVWEPSPAFLDGAIGVALGLLAAVTPVEPAWDRMLLLSGKR